MTRPSRVQIKHATQDHSGCPKRVFDELEYGAQQGELGQL